MRTLTRNGLIGKIFKSYSSFPMFADMVKVERFAKIVNG